MKALSKQKNFFVILLILFTISGCMESISPKENGVENSGSAMPTYSGCIDGISTDIDKIYLTYEYPAWASEIYIIRDGTEVFQYDQDRKEDNYFIDLDLYEGHKYVYQCQALYKYTDSKGDPQEKIITGSNSLEITTNSVNSPVFAGITSVDSITSNKVSVSWSSPNDTGAEVNYFQLFYKIGSSLDMDNTTPFKTVPFYNFATTLESLGDELPYTFGVRACSEDNVCSDNVNTITKSMTDSGEPTTTGASKAELDNGTVVLTIPWSEANGAVKRRRIYRSTVGGTNVDADYNQISSVLVSDLGVAPATTFTDISPAENTTYTVHDLIF